MQDLFYNPKNNSGYLVTKQKNSNTKKHKVEGTYGSTKKQKLTSNNDTDNESETELDEEDNIFFRNCIVSEHFDIIKKRLEKTVDVRSKIFLKEIDLYQEFPFFFFSAELVSICDFIGFNFIF